MTASLLVVGHDRSTALGARLDTASGVEVEGLAGAIAAAPGPVGIVVGAAGDTLALAKAALAHGVPVLVEPVGRCSAEDLQTLAAAPRVYAGLRRRFESDARWARGRVAAGAGLTWAVHAETLSSRAADPTTEALDLLDTATSLTGCALLAATRFDRGRGAPATWLLAFEHRVTGQLVVRMADRVARRTGAPELATIRLLASHGLVAADLDGPIQRVVGRRGALAEHVGPDGTDRLLAAFRGVVEGTGGPAPVAIGALVGMRRMLGSPPGRTRRA